MARTIERVGQLLSEQGAFLGVASALVCCLAASFVFLKWMRIQKIKKKINRARENRDRGFAQMEKAVIEFKKQNPGVEPGSILSLSLVELTENLQNGTLSPESVLYTYIEKALEATKETNCVTVFLPECEAQLQELKQQKKKGLLYGVPVSIKEHVGYKGYASTCGLTHFLEVLDTEDSVLVQVLKKQGAIPFVKTNLPQSTFMYDCSNLIYGRTVNPLNHIKSPGGSSGGEAALIAGGGSILGIGSDTGGSIRLPSSFCGLCGIRPTAFRLSISGVTGPIGGVKSVLTTLGPMAKDVDSLVLCMQALLCDEMFLLDPTVPPIPFNMEIYSSEKPLKIGYYDTDEFFLPPPSMRRAFYQTKQLLKEAGHELIPFSPPRVDYVFNELFTRGLFADRGTSLLEKFNMDIVDPYLQPQISLYRLPNVVKRIMAAILKPVYPRIGRLYDALTGVRSAKELWELHSAIQDYSQEFISKWKNLGLDVILCPMLGPAFNLGYPGKLFAAISYTMLYNLLNFPAGVVPVSTVTEEDERELKLYTGYHNDTWDKDLKKAVEGGVGLPVAVQCVALPWQEELCLRFMKEVERVTHKKGDGRM